MIDGSTTPPRIETIIQQHYEELSRTLRRVATWVLQNPAEVGTRTLQELASLSGCSSTSFIRLARALGFRKWRDFRDGFAQVLREGGDQTSFAERLLARNLLVSRQKLIRTELNNVQGCFTEENSVLIDEAAQRMVGAGKIALVGRRSCTPVITWLHYLLRITFPDVVLADDRGGAFGLDLLGVGRGDVVVCASFAPCSRDTVAAACRARQAGAWVVGIVDSPVSALARVTDRNILVRNESQAFFDSMVGAMVVVQWLAASAAALRGPQALERAKAYQRLMVETGAFVD